MDAGQEARRARIREGLQSATSFLEDLAADYAYTFAPPEVLGAPAPNNPDVPASIATAALVCWWMPSLLAEPVGTHGAAQHDAWRTCFAYVPDQGLVAVPESNGQQHLQHEPQ